MHKKINKRLSQILGVIVVLSLLFFPFFPTLINVFAENRPVTIFGPMTIERSTGKPLTETYRVVLPSSIVGPFTIQIQNGPDGSPRVSSGSILLNGKKVLSSFELNQKVQNIEKQVNLEPTNILTINTSLKSKAQSRIRLTIVGVNTAPESEVLAEERGAIGPGGGKVALPSVGEAEFFEDPTRPVVDLSVRKVRNPSAQELFAENVGNDSTIEYIDTILELETNVQPIRDVAVRVNVPLEFTEKLLPNQKIDLFMLLNDGESESFVSLDASYDPAMGIAVATLPPSAWRSKEEETTAAYNLVPLAHAAAIKYVAWIQLASATKLSSEGIASGKYISISGNGAAIPVPTNARMTINVNAELIGRGTLQAPLDITNLTQSYSSSHRAVDYGLGGITEPMVKAAHDGTVQFKYQTQNSAGHTCPYTENGTKPDGTPLKGYGYYATITKYDPNGNNLYSTRYAHLMADGNIDGLQSGDHVSKGQYIAEGDHTGCSSGPHLHFEYWRGTLTSVHPRS